MQLAAVDIGGTFTDFVALDTESGKLVFSKSSTTPPDFERGALDCFAKAGINPASVEILRHGTTIVINTLLERSGARTALITTEGFRDILEIGRGSRPEAFNNLYRRLPPFVQRIDRLEVPERMDAQGNVVIPLDLGALPAICRKLQAEGIETVAVCLLHAWRNPQHEIEIERYLRDHTNCFVSCSHQISREFREYERTVTTVLNAYVAPHVATYLKHFGGSLREANFGGRLYLMGSNGGVLTEADTRLRSLLLVESGPVGGAAGAAEVGARIGLNNLVAFDMGGTTAKAVLIHEGEAAVSSIYWVAGYERGYPIQAAVLDIVEVGAGGGSIAGINELGALEVGPESAGALPGPACYALGGKQPTITDANLFLGRLDAGRFLGGAMPLRKDLAEQALNHLSERLSQPVLALASGILRVATLNMASAVRKVTIGQGYDPRDFAMLAFGGAGPLHAVAVARESGMQRVVVPPKPGHFSAYGMLYADFRYDLAGTIACSLDDVDLEDVERRFQELEKQGADELSSAGTTFQSVRYIRYAEMRYERQEHTIKVRLSTKSDDRAEWRRLFEETYRRRFGHATAGMGIDVVMLRLVVEGVSIRPEMRATLTQGISNAKPSQRQVWFEETGMAPCEVWQRDDLKIGQRIAGPAVLEEDASTTVIGPGDIAEIDNLGNIIITLRRH